MLTKNKVSKVDNKYFGEGADFFTDKAGDTYFYELTWQENKILKYNHKLKLLKKIDADGKIREGWGMTHDPDKPNIFYVSDGSSLIHECDALQDMKVISSHNVI